MLAHLDMWARDLLETASLARLIEGFAFGVAVWSMLYALQILPGSAADYPALLWAAAGGAVLCATRWGRRLTVLLLGCNAAVLVIVSATPVSESLAVRWMRIDPMPDSGVAAVVALSAGLNPDSTMSSEGLDHLLVALELIRANKSRVLVTTSVQDQFPTGMVSSDADQARMVGLFGPGITWLRHAPTKSTREEAVRVAARLLPLGMRHIAVIASPMHTRRACATFEAVGFTVECLASRSRTPGGWPSSTWPVDRLARFGAWVYEVAALATYERRGWLAPPRGAGA